MTKCFICHKRFKTCIVLTIENPKTGKDIYVHEKCFKKMYATYDNQAAQECLIELDTPRNIGQMTFNEFLDKCIKENTSDNEFFNQMIANGMTQKGAEASTQTYRLIQEAIISGRVSTRIDKYGKMKLLEKDILRFEASIQKPGGNA